MAQKNMDVIDVHKKSKSKHAITVYDH